MRGSLRFIRSILPPTCEYCDGEVWARGYCSAHYQRWRTGRDLTTPLCKWSSSGSRIQPFHLMSTASLKPQAAHKRVYKMWGKASQYCCIECGQQAQQWAYDGTDITQMYGVDQGNKRRSKVFFSRWPEFYMPMCIVCHTRKDSLANAKELEEYREWKIRNPGVEL